MEGFQWGRRGIIVGKGKGISSITGRQKIDREGKNSMGNGETKDLLCTTHKMGGMLVGVGVQARGE